MSSSVIRPALMSATRPARVEVRNLSLDFPLYHGSARSLKKSLVGAASDRFGFGGGRSDLVLVRALRDIGFSLAPGERLGLIGGNGAGKSSLLRALAGIYEPLRGEVLIEGTIAALVDPGQGMNGELTGRENIMLGGRYAGLSRARTRQLVEDVEAFAQLNAFLDLPVRFYSAGMTVRLGFGLATAIAPQVLLMDEWFMAGDTAFQARAQSRLESVVRQADILVLTTHTMPVLRAWSTRVIWLDQGRIRADGAPGAVIDAYLAEVGDALGVTIDEHQGLDPALAQTLLTAPR